MDLADDVQPSSGLHNIDMGLRRGPRKGPAKY
jgi:hypothetical protein